MGAGEEVLGATTAAHSDGDATRYLITGPEGDEIFRWRQRPPGDFGIEQGTVTAIIVAAPERSVIRYDVAVNVQHHDFALGLEPDSAHEVLRPIPSAGGCVVVNERSMNPARAHQILFVLDAGDLAMCCETGAN